MRKTNEWTPWVVYLRTIYKQETGRVAICEQSEWDEMELARPGFHKLIQEGIGTEVEAEKLARSQPGVTPVPTPRLKSRV